MAEWSADGTVRRLGCFADDGSPASREELLAAVGPLQPLDEFMAQMCPASSPERAALADFWLVRLLQLGERGAAAQAAERMELVALLAAERPATDDVPAGRAGAPGPDARRERDPEVMDVSEWLPAELALVHPYGDRRAAELARIC